MEFRILGPLEVSDNGERIELGARKQRALLVVLLLDANRVVARDALIEALWGERPPATATKALQVHISQLRKALGRERIVTRSSGYELRLDPDELDADRFERLVAAERYGEALELWRGAPLADFAYEAFAQSDIARLEERRAACVELRIESDLESGRHAALIGELEQLVREHPMRERLRGQLMLALYRSGRQAEALEAYQDARRTLTDELGIEPSQQLRELQQAILRQDSSVEREPAAGTLTAASTFVGRERELETLRTGLDDAIHGQGRLVLLGGEPGIGKSRLAEEALRVAHQRRARVLVGRCWEAGGAPAYWPWVQALRSYLHDCPQELLRAQLGTGAAELAQLLPELRERISDLPEPPAPGSDGARLRLFDAVATLLKNIAQDQPVVLFLDDVHAADESSLLLLRFLARELAHARLLVLAAYRDADPTLRDPLRTTLSELVREPVTRRISLVGLVHDEIADYISMVARVEPGARAVAEIHAETAGNALFVGEIVRLLAAQGRLDAAGGSLEIPAGIREVIGSRVARLTEPCRKLLSTASVLGREFGVEVLQHLSDLPEETLYDGLDEAMAERIIGDVPGAHNRLRFAHVLIRDTLYEDLTAARRMQRHREAALALERAYASDLGPHLAEIALHFVSAGPESTSFALDYARRAASQAASSLAFEEAARLYNLALTLPMSDAMRCEVFLTLGDVLARAGDTPASKRRFDQAAALAEKLGLAEQLGHAALGYGGRIVWEVSRDDDHLIPLLERALDELAMDDSVLRVRLLARLAGPLRDARFAPERRHAAAGEALAMARRLNDPPTLAYALAAYLPAHMDPARTEDIVVLATELIDLAIATRELERAAEGYLCRACPLLELGRVEEAKADLDQMAMLAEQLRQPAQTLYVTNLRAHFALLEGNFISAEHLIDEALELGERAQRWNARITHRLQLFLLRDAQGRLAELSEIYEAHPVLEFRTYRIFDCVLARFYDKLGRRDDARAKFEELAVNDFAGVPVDEEWLASICLLAETAASLGDATRGTVLYELLMPYRERVGTSYPEINLGAVSRYLALLAANERRWADAVGHFEHAIKLNRRIGARPWLAHTQEDFAGMLLARAEARDSETAHQLMDDAMAAYHELGMAGPLGNALPRART
jgi:DNA-binding SARP family transcriptional activator/tetratricopeptide (TPR) repeat protein